MTEIVGRDEVGQMASKLIVVVVVKAFDGGILDGAVHPFDLSVGPRVLHLGRAVLDTIVLAGTPEDVLHGSAILLAVFELDAVVGEDRVYLVGNRLNEVAQELGCDHLGCPLVQLDIGEFAGPIDGHKEVELPLGGLHLGDVDVKVADRVALELFLGFLVASDIRQARDAVALQAAMQ